MLPVWWIKMNIIAGVAMKDWRRREAKTNLDFVRRRRAVNGRTAATVSWQPAALDESRRIQPRQLPRRSCEDQGRHCRQQLVRRRCWRRRTSEWWRRREADRCLLSTLADIIFTDPSSRPGRALGRLSVCVCVVRVSGPWLRNETISDLDIWLADTCWPFLSILVDQVGMSKL